MKLAALLFSMTAWGAVTISPANHATRVNPDTHLVLTFSSAPTLGKSGAIRIYEAADHKLVDTLDLSIPAGPDPSHRVTNPPVTAFVSNDPTSPTTTTPAVRTAPADLHNYQLTTIGGLPDFHFYPVIIHENVATIYPHNNVLKYGHEYIVQIRRGRVVGRCIHVAIHDEGRGSSGECDSPGGVGGRQRRFFDHSGRGRFHSRRSCAARHGVHQERQLRRDCVLPQEIEHHVSRRGSRKGSGGLRQQQWQPNPLMPGPSRRCAFSAYDSTGIEFTKLVDCINNYYTGQCRSAADFRIEKYREPHDAQSVRAMRSTCAARLILRTAPSSATATRSSALVPRFLFAASCNRSGRSCGFATRTRITATFSSIRHSSRSSDGCRGTRPRRCAAFTRACAAAWVNHGLNYPYAEAVLINCKLSAFRRRRGDRSTTTRPTFVFWNSTAWIWTAIPSMCRSGILCRSSCGRLPMLGRSPTTAIRRSCWVVGLRWSIDRNELDRLKPSPTIPRCRRAGWLGSGGRSLEWGSHSWLQAAFRRLDRLKPIRAGAGVPAPLFQCGEPASCFSRS